MKRAQLSRQLATEARERFDQAHAPPGRETTDAEERDRMADRREADADERERIADRREADADERERRADQRDTDADERDTLADRRERLADMRNAPQAAPRPGERAGRRFAALADSFPRLREEQARLRSQSARLADQMADGAEAFATWLEATAAKGDRDRRLAMAASEREVAKQVRDNASRWRAVGAGQGPRTPSRRVDSVGPL